MSDDVPPEVAEFGLHPHPEGGFYRETWRSEYLTVIDYLLLPGTYSGWHRVDGSDEVWNHHRGGTLRLHLLSDEGVYEAIDLGTKRFSAVVPAGWWQAAEAMDDQWVLTGCTVAPPFDFTRFTMADATLFERFPVHATHRRLLRS